MLERGTTLTLKTLIGIAGWHCKNSKHFATQSKRYLLDFNSTAYHF